MLWETVDRPVKCSTLNLLQFFVQKWELQFRAYFHSPVWYTVPFLQIESLRSKNRALEIQDGQANERWQKKVDELQAVTRVIFGELLQNTVYLLLLRYGILRIFKRIMFREFFDKIVEKWHFS